MSWIRSVGWSLQIGQKEKGFIKLVFFCQGQNGSVKSNENGNLHNGRQTAGQGVDFICLVEFGYFLVHNFGVGLVLGLYRFDARLQSL